MYVYCFVDACIRDVYNTHVIHVYLQSMFFLEKEDFIAFQEQYIELIHGFRTKTRSLCLKIGTQLKTKN
jgi:hypothetical protein